MHVKLPAGVYRLYLTHAGIRIVQGDHIVEDPVTYFANGVRVKRNSYIEAFDFRTLKELRIAMECDEVLSSFITWHKAILNAAIELLDPTMQEIQDATHAANNESMKQHSARSLQADLLKTDGRIRTGVSARLSSDTHDVVTRGSDVKGGTVFGHAARRFIKPLE